MSGFHSPWHISYRVSRHSINVYSALNSPFEASDGLIEFLFDNEDFPLILFKDIIWLYFACIEVIEVILFSLETVSVRSGFEQTAGIHRSYYMLIAVLGFPVQ